MISSLFARLRSFWRGVRQRSGDEAEMNEEFGAHIELRAADLVHGGLSRAEAMKQARREFGSPERYKADAREARGLNRVDALRFSVLDFKLGLRMLVRYPGLTIVGGLAMAFAIWIGAGTFEVVTRVVYPKLPLPGGDRIVGIRLWDARALEPEHRVWYDLGTWREQLATVQDVGAFRTVDRNLVTEDGGGEPVKAAEISASAFRVAGVTPRLGRSLDEADEQAGAPHVVVLGHDVWQTRFGGDPDIIGRAVRLGSEQSTVVGVMPEGFAFPVNHNLWTPLRLNPLDYGPREGPGIRVFGRLAPGATLGDAQSELTVLGQRAAADHPDTHRHLRPQVDAFAQAVWNVDAMESLVLLSSNLFLVMLLILVCGNVALLMFARAATREGEIVVRNALGASRGRIITQLFTESLVLGGLAAVVGLVATGYGVRWALRMAEAEFMDGGGQFPFWFNGGLSPATVMYAVVLTVLSALITGAGPGLKVTRGVGARLRQLSAGGGGLKLSGIWTAVIVAQVAVTVAFPAVAFFVRRELEHVRTLDVGFTGKEYLSVQLELDRETATGQPVDTSGAAFRARFAARYAELDRRLTRDPAVAGVTVADVLPRMYHGWNQVEMDRDAALPRDSILGHRVSSATIDVDYFDVLRAPIVAGRNFDPADAASGARVVIVNQTFVARVLGGRNAIGRRVRYITGESSYAPTQGSEAHWYEIVGVAKDLGMGSGYGRAGLYHPLVAGDISGVHMAIHVRGEPQSFAGRLRFIAAAVDPTLRLSNLMTLDRVADANLRLLELWFQLTVLVSAVALLLSLAAIYAVMSFTVSRRTREIGIRVALGARAQRVVISIVWRPLAQVALGIVAGGALVVALVFGVTGGELNWQRAALIAAYALLMLSVCMLACIVPTWRALRVQPTDALRAEG